jgi:hypothetical protein
LELGFDDEVATVNDEDFTDGKENLLEDLKLDEEDSTSSFQLGGS